MLTPLNRTACSPYGSSAQGAPPALSPPLVTSNPNNASVTLPATATFTAVATGSPTLTYQWFNNGVAIPGALSASYTTPATTILDNGHNFRCQVSNPYGQTWSLFAYLTVTDGAAGVAPTFTQNPESAPVWNGQSSYPLYASATGTPTPTYQWQEQLGRGMGAWSDIVPLNDPWTWIAPGSATTSTLTFLGNGKFTTADTGRVFRCKATNSAGTAYSSSSSITLSASGGDPNGTAGVFPVTSMLLLGQQFTSTVSANTGSIRYPTTMVRTNNVYGGVDLTVQADFAKMVDGNGSTGGRLWLNIPWPPVAPTPQLIYQFSGWSGSFASSPTLKIVFSELNFNYGYDLAGAQTAGGGFIVELKNGGSGIATAMYMSVAQVQAWKAGNTTGPWTLTLTGFPSGSCAGAIVNVYVGGAADLGPAGRTLDDYLKINEITLEA